MHFVNHGWPYYEMSTDTYVTKAGHPKEAKKYIRVPTLKFPAT